MSQMTAWCVRVYGRGLSLVLQQLFDAEPLEAAGLLLLSTHLVRHCSPWRPVVAISLLLETGLGREGKGKREEGRGRVSPGFPVRFGHQEIISPHSGGGVDLGVDRSCY